VNQLLWETGPPLLSERSQFGSTLFEDQFGKLRWWVTGGSGQGGIPLDTTELLDMEEQMEWASGPPLPYKVSQHCMGKVL
jgi:hypothetical protein